MYMIPESEKAQKAGQVKINIWKKIVYVYIHTYIHMYYCTIKIITEEQVRYIFTYLIQHQGKIKVNQEIILEEAMVYRIHTVHCYFCHNL